MANRKTVKKHAKQRLKSRVGVVGNKINDLIEKVLQEGKRIIDLEDSELKTFLFEKYPSNTRKKRIYLYENVIYVFDKNKDLITCYELEIKESIRFIKKRKEFYD